MTKPVFDVVKSREAEGLILYLKCPQSMWVFRVVPVRDDAQPRFWCLRIEPCAEASPIAAPSPQSPFYSAPAMTRDELLETLTTLRTEASTWLDEPGQRNLLAWMRQVVSNPIPAALQPRLPALKQAAAKATPPAPERKNGSEQIAQAAGSVD